MQVHVNLVVCVTEMFAVLDSEAVRTKGKYTALQWNKR